MGISWIDDKGKWQVKSTTDYENMRKVLVNPENTLVCHNIVRFDVPLYEKILGIKVRASVVDSLGLSWYLYPERGQRDHGLASYGIEFGILKTKVEGDEWAGLDKNKIDIINYYERG
jgi:DNA polymerase III alpha subunit (gram-positive type)